MILTLGVIAIFIWISLILNLIPKYGLQFLLLSCPNCNKKGGLRKNWKFSTKMEKRIDSEIIDDEMAHDTKKVLSCKWCNHEVVLK